MWKRAVFVGVLFSFFSSERAGAKRRTVPACLCMCVNNCVYSPKDMQGFLGLCKGFFVPKNIDLYGNNMGQNLEGLCMCQLCMYTHFAYALNF